MAYLLLGNVEDDTSDKEIQAFLVKYGFPQFDGIDHKPGDDSRPAVLVTFRNVEPETLHNLLPRIHNIVWKERKLSAILMNDRYY